MPVTLKEANDKTYKLSDFDFLPPWQPSHEAQATSAEKRSGLCDGRFEGVSETERHDALISLSGKLMSRGVQEEAAQVLLASGNQENIPPLDEKELTSTVSDICIRYGDKPLADAIANAEGKDIPALIQRIAQEPQSEIDRAIFIGQQGAKYPLTSKNSPPILPRVRRNALLSNQIKSIKNGGLVSFSQSGGAGQHHGHCFQTAETCSPGKR